MIRTKKKPWRNGCSHNLKGELLYELLNVIDKLPMEFRDVLLLKDFQQLANKDIAEELNISLATVKSRLHRARRMTRTMLLD